jgi:hypothetical protein
VFGKWQIRRRRKEDAHKQIAGKRVGEREGGGEGRGEREEGGERERGGRGEREGEGVVA